MGREQVTAVSAAEQGQSHGFKGQCYVSKGQLKLSSLSGA